MTSNVNRIAKALTVEDLQAIGVSLADTFTKADTMADKTKRQALLKTAKAHANDDSHIKNILDGFAKRFEELGMSASSAKVRKAEAKAVFDAVGKGLVSGDTLKKLEAFDGGYHEFISLARSLRDEGSDNNGGRKQEPTVKTKMTLRQHEMVEKAISHADVKQLAEVAEQSIVNITKNAPAELAGIHSFRLIRSACTQLINNPATEPVFKKAAKEIDAIAENIIERAQKAAEVAAQAGKSGNVETEHTPEEKETN